MGELEEGRWVLVVSSDEGLASRMAKRFHQDGLRVRATSRGAQALFLASASPPALVIVDGPLEDMGGPKLAAWLRGIDNRILVIVAGEDDATLEQEAREAGILHFAARPVDVERLYAIVRRALALPPGPRSGTAVTTGDQPDE